MTEKKNFNDYLNRIENNNQQNLEQNFDYEDDLEEEDFDYEDDLEEEDFDYEDDFEEDIEFDDNE